MAIFLIWYNRKIYITKVITKLKLSFNKIKDIALPQGIWFLKNALSL